MSRLKSTYLILRHDVHICKYNRYIVCTQDTTISIELYSLLHNLCDNYDVMAIQ